MMTCLIIEDEKMSRNVLTDMIERHSSLRLLGSFEKPEEAISFLATQSIDVLFLDIEMPLLSGFDVLDTLHKKPYVIITTSHQDYAYKGFEYDVDDFMLKPFTLKKFLETIHKINTLNSVEEMDHIFVKIDSKLEKILFREIRYIEALGDYAKIFTETEMLLARTTMKDLETKLTPSTFIRIHRSYIINIHKVITIEDNTVIIDKTILPIAKSYKDGLMKRLNLL